jgi:stage III sporulation protein AE
MIYRSRKSTSLFFLILIVLLTILSGCPAVADNVYSDTLKEPTYPYGDLLESLPEDAKDLLPEGIGESATAEDVLRAMDSKYLWSLCTAMVQSGLKGGLSLFATLLGVILIAGVLHRLGELFFTDKSAVFEYALVLIAALQIYSSVYTLFDLTKTVVEQINQYMDALVAALCGIFLLTGNTGVALAGSTWMGLLLTVTEKLCYSIFFPLLQISFGGTLVTSASSELNLRPILAFLRRICTTLLVIFMTVITLILSFQTQLATAADSLSMRGIKFAASNMIPMIGGLFSDTLRTIATSLSLVKHTAGLIGLLGLLVSLMTPLTALFTARYSLSLAGTAAELLDAGKLKPLFEEADKLVGFLISVLLMFGVFYLLLLGVLIHTSTAMGG